MNRRSIAVISGLSLIVMAIVAGFSFGYAYPELYLTEEPELLKENILQNKGLYQYMLIGIAIIILLDILVAFSLYKYFASDHKNISFISGLLRVVYAIIFGIAMYFLAINLSTNELTNQMIKSNFDKFQAIWNSGLIIFGFHILLIGILMKLHKKIPSVLWTITLIAGLSYVMVNLLKIENSAPQLVKYFEMVLALPMIIGELGFAVWLLVRGGKGKGVDAETIS